MVTIHARLCPRHSPGDSAWTLGHSGLSALRVGASWAPLGVRGRVWVCVGLRERVRAPGQRDHTEPLCADPKRDLRLTLQTAASSWPQTPSVGPSCRSRADRPTAPGLAVNPPRKPLLGGSLQPWHSPTQELSQPQPQGRPGHSVGLSPARPDRAPRTPGLSLVSRASRELTALLLFL